MTKPSVWSDNDLTAQAVLFFLAGFDTVCTVMIFALHELPTNPDTQDRLLQEIWDSDAQSGGEFDYKSIQNSEILDYGYTNNTERVRAAPECRQAGLGKKIITWEELTEKPNTIMLLVKREPYDTIRKGAIITIPSWAIHRNPKLFDNPNKFEPDRFSDENKHLMKPFTYTPFAVGRRNGIGSRFALCEVKVMVYQILQHFTLSLCEKLASLKSTTRQRSVSGTKVVIG